MTTKPKRKWNGQSIPMSHWGRDHWSTLLYVECRVVDNQGRLDGRHLRLDGNAYPSKLVDCELVGHTDADCIADMEVAGLVVNEGTGTNMLCRLTGKGWRVAHALRRHRANSALETFDWKSIK